MSSSAVLRSHGRMRVFTQARMWCRLFGELAPLTALLRPGCLDAQGDGTLQPEGEPTGPEVAAPASQIIHLAVVIVILLCLIL